MAASCCRSRISLRLSLPGWPAGVAGFPGAAAAPVSAAVVQLVLQDRVALVEAAFFSAAPEVAVIQRVDVWDPSLFRQVLLQAIGKTAGRSSGRDTAAGEVIEGLDAA